jgi:hypothetical protein
MHDPYFARQALRQMNALPPFSRPQPPADHDCEAGRPAQRPQYEPVAVFSPSTTRESMPSKGTFSNQETIE